MKIIVIKTNYSSGNITIAVEEKEVVSIAHLLESHPKVVEFYVDGLNVKSQQKLYGVGDFYKWISRI